MWTGLVVAALSLLQCSHTRAFEIIQGGETSEIFVLEMEVGDKMAQLEKAIQHLERDDNEYPCWSAIKYRLKTNVCKEMTMTKKNRIALSMTNCHYENSGLDSFPCPDTQPVKECLQKLGQRTVMFQTFTSFMMHIESICFHVQRETFHASTQRAVHALYSATQDTAKNLQQFAADSKSMGDRVLADLSDRHAKLKFELGSLQEDQIHRFQSLDDKTTRLGHGQDALLASLEHATQELEASMTESLSVQQEVRAGQALILGGVSQTQAGVADLDSSLKGLHEETTASFKQALGSMDTVQRKQLEMVGGMEEARLALGSLAQQQQASFAEASSQTQDLQKGQTAILDDVHKSQDRLQALSLAQEAGFKTTQQQQEVVLDDLRTHAKKTMQDLEAARATILASQGYLDELVQGQGRLQAQVTSARSQLGALQEDQKEAFTTAQDHLEAIAEQSKMVEARVTQLFTEMTAGLNRLVTMDYSILNELFKISSTIFYLGVAALCILLTSAKTTARIRFPLLGALLLTLFAEQYLWTIIEYFHISPEGCQMLCTFIRKGFFLVAVGLCGRASWRFQDYPELSFEAVKKNQRFLQGVLSHLHNQASHAGYDVSHLEAFREDLDLDPGFSHQHSSSSSSRLQVEGSPWPREREEHVLGPVNEARAVLEDSMAPLPPEADAEADEREEGVPASEQRVHAGPPPASSSSSSEPRKCGAHTNKGTPCTRLLKRGKRHCHAHREPGED